MSKVWTAEDVRKLQAIAQDVISLSSIVGDPEREGQDGELGDFIQDNGPTPEDRAISDSTKELLLQIIKTILSPKEEKVIKLRYGFETGNSMTLAEVGKVFNVTRERIRQVEKRALEKIRKKLARMNLEKEDL